MRIKPRSRARTRLSEMKGALAPIAAAIFATVAAQAQQPAWTAKSVHLRAGPARDYPVVLVLPPRTPVTVYSCVSGYAWCDVAAGAQRGWVYAPNLVSTYEGREARLPEAAPALGIGIAAFAIEDYWRRYYPRRWWYPLRRRWFRHPYVPPMKVHPPGHMERPAGR
jgi:uncharacterized protein YraI